MKAARAYVGVAQTDQRTDQRTGNIITKYYFN